MRHEHPFPGNVLQTVLAFASPDVPDDEAGRHFTTNLDEAAVVTSLVDGTNFLDDHRRTHEGSLHRPVLDIDFDVKVVPSTTPGHFHLYLDHQLTWAQYLELLDVLQRIGIIEPGYESASKRRGFTAVRLPWVAKKPGESAGYGDEAVTATFDDPRCFRCGRSAAECYPEDLIEEAGSPARMARSDGTYNPDTFHFACDRCYIAIGQPSSPTGWRAP